MTTTNPTPRDLDPNRKKTADKPDNTPMIVHRVPYVDSDGVQRTKEYGPMPASDFDQWLKNFESGKVSE